MSFRLTPPRSVKLHHVPRRRPPSQRLATWDFLLESHHAATVGVVMATGWNPPYVLNGHCHYLQLIEV
jgi:hypothetical protein